MPKTKKQKIDYFNNSCIDNNSNFEISYTNQFLKAVKKHFKTKNDLFLLCDVILQLSKDGDLKQKKYKAHNLQGNFKNYREAHIKPDMLIVWNRIKNNITLVLLGTHTELFD